MNLKLTKEIQSLVFFQLMNFWKRSSYLLVWRADVVYLGYESPHEIGQEFHGVNRLYDADTLGLKLKCNRFCHNLSQRTKGCGHLSQWTEE